MTRERLQRRLCWLLEHRYGCVSPPSHEFRYQTVFFGPGTPSTGSMPQLHDTFGVMTM